MKYICHIIVISFSSKREEIQFSDITNYQ